MRTSKGFTLIEVLVVVIVLGVITSFAVPGLRKMMQRASEDDARIGLLGIYTASQNYNKKNQGYWESTTSNLTVLSGTLNINLVPSDGITYTYNVNSGTPVYEATAHYNQGGTEWYVDITLDQPLATNNPCCRASYTCPTIPSC